MSSFNVPAFFVESCCRSVVQMESWDVWKANRGRQPAWAMAWSVNDLQVSAGADRNGSKSLIPHYLSSRLLSEANRNESKSVTSNGVSSYVTVCSSSSFLSDSTSAGWSDPSGPARIIGSVVLAGWRRDPSYWTVTGPWTTGWPFLCLCVPAQRGEI